MKKADLHLHSKYSKKSDADILNFMKAQESYADIYKIYDEARRRNMDYVTLTDHNTIEGCLRLKEKHPKRVFISVESTVYFPDTKAAFHLLIYNIDEEKFKMIEELRKNVYELRSYLNKNNIFHSVAHCLYPVNDKFDIDHLEKLILLFNNFEGCNGALSNETNNLIMRLLSNLDNKVIVRLVDKHNIEPVNPLKAAEKCFTAGSDDHSGLFIGKTFTSAKGDDYNEFIINIKNGKSKIMMDSMNFKEFSLHIAKIALEHIIHNSKKAPTFVEIMNNLIENESKLRDKIKINFLKKSENSKILKNSIKYLSKEMKNDDMKYNSELIYKEMTYLSNYYISHFANKLFKNKEFDFKSIFGDLNYILGVILSFLPVFFSIKNLRKDRKISANVESKILGIENATKKKIVWFTDTINDLNGVSITLKKIGHLSYERGDDLVLVSSLDEKDITNDLPANYLNLSPLASFELPYYEKLRLKIPPILNTLEKIYNINPDEIYISSPGPIGLIGLIASKILNIPSTVIYHTDFSEQVMRITNNSIIYKIVETYTKVFHEACDRILVPTNEYKNILISRGFDKDKIDIFKRGFDYNNFVPSAYARENIIKKYNIKDGFNILYTGRISEDKNVDFIIDIFKTLKKDYHNVNLILAGDGPYLEVLKNRNKDEKNIIFTGFIHNKNLPDVYASADLFVFPSETDTFGMSVIEAQACGLPVIVSDIGGPKEIVIDGETGYVVSTKNKDNWIERIRYFINLKENKPDIFMKYKVSARNNVISNYCWNKCLDRIFLSNSERRAG